MFSIIGGWFAKQAFQIGIGIGALIGVVLIPVAASQYVTINGWPIFGHGGLRGEVASLHKEIDEPLTGYRARLGQSHANEGALTTGLAQCNASVDDLKRKGDAATAKANAELARLRANNAAVNRQVGAILAAKPGDDLCASADALILGGAP